MSRPPKPWLRKSDGVWHVQIDGKQIRLAKDKKEAFAKFDRIKAAGKAPNPVTVREVIIHYWEWLKAEGAPETAIRRKPILNSFAEFVPASLKAEALTPGHVQKWMQANSKAKVRRKSKRTEGMEVVDTDRPVSPTTRNTRITLLIGVFNWAKRMRYVSENPIKDMPKPAPVTRQEFVPADLWHKVLALATDDAFRDFLLVMLSAGCRVTEAVRFEAQHFNGSAIVLPIGDSKGKKRSRVVFLPDVALEIVAKLAKQYPEGKLFRNRRGKPWGRNSIRCRFRRLKRLLKMPWLTATHLRHSFAHYRLTQGQDALTVAKLMGHVDTRMIATRYGHLEQNAEYMLGAANSVGFPVHHSGDATTPGV